jgi:hypothetical protein
MSSNPHFYANPVNVEDDNAGVKPLTARQVGDVRRQQVADANEHARTFPNGNAPSGPERDNRGVLTRAAMIGILSAGGSVRVPEGVGIRGGQIVNRVEDLPSEAELAQGDPDAERRALESLDRAQAELDRQRVAVSNARANRERSGVLAAQRGAAYVKPGGPGDPAAGHDAVHGSEAARDAARRAEQAENQRRGVGDDITMPTQPAGPVTPHTITGTSAANRPAEGGGKGDGDPDADPRDNEDDKRGGGEGGNDPTQPPTGSNAASATPGTTGTPPKPQTPPQSGGRGVRGQGGGNK